MLRTNAPKMITVVAAIALTLVGLHLTILHIGFVRSALDAANLELTRKQGYWCLLGSPILLILGSCFGGSKEMNRNRAPKLTTIAVALVLVGIAALGTFGDVISEKPAIWSAVAATGVMLLGILFRGI